MGKSSEIKGAIVFLKIESALQMQDVVIPVTIIIMSKAVLPEQKKGPGTQKSREVTASQGRPGWSPLGLVQKVGGGGAGHATGAAHRL